MAKRTIGPTERDRLYRAIAFQLEVELDSMEHGFSEGGFDLGDDLNDVLACRRRIEDWARLLDDLGWDADDTRVHYELTLPDEQLERGVRALLDRADALLRDHGETLRGECAWEREVEALRRADGWSEEQIRAARWESVSPWLDEDLNLAAACLTVLEAVEVA